MNIKGFNQGVCEDGALLCSDRRLSNWGILRHEGIHRGDWISPLLFVVVLEYLSQRLKEAREEKRLDVYKMRGIKVETCLVVCWWCVLCVVGWIPRFNIIRIILDEFTKFSSLQINKQKSMILSQKELVIRKNEDHLGIFHENPPDKPSWCLCRGQINAISPPWKAYLIASRYIG